MPALCERPGYCVRDTGRRSGGASTGYGHPYRSAGGDHVDETEYLFGNPANAAALCHSIGDGELERGDVREPERGDSAVAAD